MMKFVSRILIAFCMFITAYASENPAQSVEELQKQLEHMLQEFHVPGMSVAIMHRDGPEWIAGIGLAEVAKQLPVTAKTRFRIGSTSKAFVSLAILQLVEEGKLSLQDSVRELVPDVWFENKWETTDPVRVVHLLEHTTGWDDTHLREYAKDDPAINLLDALEYDHTSRISRWRPGSRMAYCNSGPPVAAYIVEKLTGQSFEEYVQQNLFDPIGMKTATYSQPASDLTTLYHPNGTTPYPYWNFIMRPSGSINASAHDMAKYLLFYLNRGYVNGTQIVSENMLERMEVPTSTWAAKEGLKVGYGLSNYCMIYDGFVYHGHNGVLDGDLTEIAYMPDFQLGYFYSINSTQPEAFLKIGKILRSYMTQKLSRPSVSLPKGLPSNASEYVGWYQPNSPRIELSSFLERLLGLARIDFKNEKLFISSIGKFNTMVSAIGSIGKFEAMYLPAGGMQFRFIPADESPHPIPSVVLFKPTEKDHFIQLGLGMLTMKRIPTWLAISEITITLFVLLSIFSILLYAPIWLLGALRKARRRPSERAMRIWSLVAALSLIVVFVLISASSADLIARMGQLTYWSLALFLTTILFAVASVASAVSLWRAPQQGVRYSVRVYSTIVTVGLMITTTYLAYWGIIGLRIWA